LEDTRFADCSGYEICGLAAPSIGESRVPSCNTLQGALRLGATPDDICVITAANATTGRAGLLCRAFEITAGDFVEVH
ncbi:MAG TPA: hypothetical protein PLW35_13420, partial [Verrucomicrobiota bacterium]|nr:hypothetical protein [Verrucomicrobiota bacterium]